VKYDKRLHPWLAARQEIMTDPTRLEAAAEAAALAMGDDVHLLNMNRELIRRLVYIQAIDAAIGPIATMQGISSPDKLDRSLLAIVDGMAATTHLRGDGHIYWSVAQAAEALVAASRMMENGHDLATALQHLHSVSELTQETANGHWKIIVAVAEWLAVQLVGLVEAYEAEADRAEPEATAAPAAIQVNLPTLRVRDDASPAKRGARHFMPGAVFTRMPEQQQEVFLPLLHPGEWLTALELWNPSHPTGDKNAQPTDKERLCAGGDHPYRATGMWFCRVMHGDDEQTAWGIVCPFCGLVRVENLQMVNSI
jgi:hypothetical protein